MKKSDRIRDLIQQHASGTEPEGLDPRYIGYFTLFNAQKYYEAHDILEDLWLGETGSNHLFFKGLIQLSGAFVHLQKQAARPDHPKDGRRLHPAARLFQLAIRNLEQFAPSHLRLDVLRAIALATDCAATIEASQFTKNPWEPAHAPQLQLS
jgi:predicted metal-dependent hydrolase